MIRARIEKLLGLEFFNTKLTRMEIDLVALKTDLRALQLGIARILVKVDPDYARDPHSKEAMLESDRIGDEVIRRLKGEFKASNLAGPR